MSLIKCSNYFTDPLQVPESGQCIKGYKTWYPSSTSEPEFTTSASRQVYADGDKQVQFFVAVVNKNDEESQRESITIRTDTLRKYYYAIQ